MAEHLLWQMAKENRLNSHEIPEVFTELNDFVEHKVKCIFNQFARLLLVRRAHVVDVFHDPKKFVFKQYNRLDIHRHCLSLCYLTVEFFKISILLDSRLYTIIFIIFIVTIDSMLVLLLLGSLLPEYFVFLI